MNCLSLEELNSLVGEMMGPINKYCMKDTIDSSSIYCGYLFKVGDLIFHCQDCALDSTCVLCHHCFNPSDHEGHIIKYYPSKGGTSGCCDCGELESWKGSFNCPLGHGGMFKEVSIGIFDDNELVKDISLFISNSLLEIHQEVLNRIVQSSNDNVNISIDVEEYKEEGEGEEESEGDEEGEGVEEFMFEDNDSDSEQDDVPIATNYRMNFLPEPQTYSDNMVIVLFNDEVHSYDDVIVALCSINSNLTKTNAHSIADLVDKEGFAIISHTLSNIMEAIGILRNVHTLDCRSMSLKCANNLLLVTELFSRINSLSSTIKTQFVEVLFSPFSTPIPRLFKPLDPQIDYSLFYNSLSDIIVHWDNYHWKKLRQLISSILTSALSSTSLKIQMANALINPSNIHSLILEIGGRKAPGTREFPLTIFNFSVQIFTVQTVASQISPSSIASLLNEMENILIELKKDDATTFTFARMRSSFTFIEQIITYIYTHNPISSPLVAKTFISLLITFQNSFPIKKKIGEHILFDDQLWQSKFTLGTYLLYFIMSFIKVYPHPLDLLVEIGNLQQSSPPPPPPLDPQTFSFQQPLLWIFGAVIENSTQEELLAVEEELKMILSSFLKDFIYDFLTKLSSLIEGDWVRNGIEIPSSIRGVYSHDFLRFILISLKYSLKFFDPFLYVNDNNNDNNNPSLLSWVNSALFGVCLGDKKIEFEILNILLRRKAPSTLQNIIDSLPFYLKSYFDSSSKRIIFLSHLSNVSLKRSSCIGGSASTLTELISTDDYLFEAKEDQVHKIFSPHSFYNFSSSERKSILTYCKERFSIKDGFELRSQICGNLTILPILPSLLRMTNCSSSMSILDKTELLFNLMDNSYCIGDQIRFDKSLPSSLKEYLESNEENKDNDDDDDDDDDKDKDKNLKRIMDNTISNKRAMILKKMKEDQENFIKNQASSLAISPISSPSSPSPSSFLLESGFCIFCKELVDGETDFGVLAQENELNIISHSLCITSCFHLVHKTCYSANFTGENTPSVSPRCPLCKSPYSKFLLIPTNSISEGEGEECNIILEEIENILPYKYTPLQSYFISSALQLIAMEIGDFVAEKEVENIVRITRIIKRNICLSNSGIISLGNEPMLNMIIYLKNCTKNCTPNFNTAIETFLEWFSFNKEHYRIILLKMVTLWFDDGLDHVNKVVNQLSSIGISQGQRNLLLQMQARREVVLLLPSWESLIPQRPNEIEYSKFYMNSRNGVDGGDDDDIDTLVCFFCGSISSISCQYYQRSNALLHSRSKSHRTIFNHPSKMVIHPPNNCLHKEFGIYYYISKCAILLLLPLKMCISSQLIPAPFVTENGETDLCFNGSGGTLLFSKDRFNSIRRLWISSNVYRLVYQLTLEDVV